MKTLAQVEPRTPISSLPYTITESGSYYVTGNLSSTGHGIIIESSGVTVDLMGFSLTGDVGECMSCYGIHMWGSTNAAIDKVVIKGGVISGFSNGLRLGYTNGSRIEGLMLSGNIFEGVYFSGSHSSHCLGNTLSDCTITGNGGAGVVLNGFSGQCNGNTITDCTIGGNGDEGVKLNANQSGQCNGNNISASTIIDNKSYGVYLECSLGQCSGNTIRGNRIEGNVDGGIYIFWGNGNRVEDNNVWGTTGEGITYGIRTWYTEDNFILNNTCVGNGTNFELDPDDIFIPVEITSEIANIQTQQSAQQADINQVQEQAEAIQEQNNVLLGEQTNLQTQQSSIQGIMDTNQASTEAAITTSQTAVLAGQATSQAAINQVQEQAESIQEQNNILLGEQTNLQTQQAAIQDDPRTPISSLPYTISEPGSYYVTGNLNSTGSGIIIESSGVTVDLMGFSLTGDGAGESGEYGIEMEGSAGNEISDVAIKGGRINGFNSGLYCRYMNNSRIEGLVISGSQNEHGPNNLWGGLGIRLSSSMGNRIAHCSISGNQIAGIILSGMSANPCNENTITDCTISGNTALGVYLIATNGECDGNTISDCTISNNGGKGVFLMCYQGRCKGNTIADCSINGNGDHGVFLDGESGQCNGNTITGSTISGGGHIGVYLRGESGQCNGNTITDCTISENGDYGVMLDGRDSGQCNGNTIQDNRISKNTTKGIRLYHADGNRVEANNVWGTTGGEYGIQTTTGTSNFILKNTCVGNGTNYELDSDDTFGPIVDAAGELGSADGAWHPWANFSR
jgi:parallel beta-helix repeat protein